MASRKKFVALLGVLVMTAVAYGNDEFSLEIALDDFGAIYSPAPQPFEDDPGILDSYSDGVGAIVLAYPEVCFQFGAPTIFHDQALWDQYGHLVPAVGEVCEPAKFRTGAGELWATEITTSGLVAGSFTFFPDDVQLELRWGYAESWNEFAPKLLVTKNGDTDGCAGVEADCWSVEPHRDPTDAFDDDMATLFVFIPKGGNRGRHAVASFSMPFELVATRAGTNLRGSSSGGGGGGGKGNGRGGGGGA